MKLAAWVETLDEHGLTTVEEHAVSLVGAYPKADVVRARDVLHVTLDEAGVFALVTPEALELRLATIEWTGGAYGPRESSRLWMRLDLENMSRHAVLQAVEAAIEARRSEFVPCEHCGRPTPPEESVRPGLCHGCAEEQEGVVF